MCVVAELPGYSRLADKLLTVEERSDLINYLAAHPKAGDLMVGTGGVHVVDYDHNTLMPIYLLTLFAKGDKANLSKAERNELAALTDILRNIWNERADP